MPGRGPADHAEGPDSEEGRKFRGRGGAPPCVWARVVRHAGGMRLRGAVLCLGLVACHEPDKQEGSSSGEVTDCRFTALKSCGAPLCGTVDPADRPDDVTCAASEPCAPAALRDRTAGLLSFQTCGNTGCESFTILILADGRAFRDHSSFDAEVGSQMFGRPVPCELAEAELFSDCLSAFDPSCTPDRFLVSCRNDEPICACP